MKLKDLSLQNMVFTVYSIFVLSILILPRLQYTTSYVELFVLSFPLIAFACLLDFSVLKRIYPIFVYLGLMFIFRAICNTWGNLSAALNLSFVLYLGLLGYFLFEAAQKMNNDVLLKIIIAAALLMFCIIAINTFRELAIRPGVARLLARGTQDDKIINALRMKNVGGFGFSYAVGMFIPYVASLIIRSKGLLRAAFIALLIILFVYIFNTQYTTLLLLASVFTIFVFFINIKKPSSKLIAIFLIIILLFSLKHIFLFLAENIKLTALSSRFEDIYITLSGGESDSSRWQLQADAFKLFFQNPLFGADLNDAQNLYIVNHSHSTFSGILAGGGIAAFLCYFGILYFAMNNIKRMLPSFKNIQPVFLHLLILSLLNPINSFEILLVVYLIIPAIELLFNKRMERKKHGEEVLLEN